MHQRITRRLRAAKRRLQQLPELYEAYILMRFPFHRLKEDVAAYERAVNMYANHVDEIIDNLKRNRNGREYLVTHAPSLRTLDDACDSFLQSIGIQTEVIIKPLHPDRYPRLIHRMVEASKRRTEAQERYAAAMQKEAEIIQIEYEANHPENNGSEGFPG